VTPRNVYYLALGPNFFHHCESKILKFVEDGVGSCFTRLDAWYLSSSKNLTAKIFGRKRYT